MTLERIASPEGNTVEAGEMPEPSSRSAGSRAKRALRGLVGESRSMRGIRERLEKLALYNVPILLVGERGTGKEFVARTLHELTTPGGPFVKVRCASTPDAGLPLLESAPNGTVFLDGIEDATGTLLDSLGALLDTRRLQPALTPADAPPRVRVVASLRHSSVSDVALPPELLAPIAGFTLTLPPLRERLADVGLLATAFLEHFARSHGATVRTLSSGALAALRKSPWPGNVRQLRAVVEAAAIVSCDAVIEREVLAECLVTVPRFDGPRTSAPAPAPVSAVTTPPPVVVAPSFPSLRDLERTLILSAWTDHENNLTRAASHLGIPRSTLRDKLRKYGVI